MNHVIVKPFSEEVNDFICVKEGSGIYAAIGDDKIYTSKDGKTWEAHTSEYFSEGFRNLPVLECVRPSTWLLSDEEMGILISRNNCETWERIDAIDYSTKFEIVAPDDKLTIIAVSKYIDDLIFYTADCKSWHKVDMNSSFLKMGTPSYVTYHNSRLRKGNNDYYTDGIYHISTFEKGLFYSRDGIKWNKCVIELYNVEDPEHIMYVNKVFHPTNDIWYSSISIDRSMNEYMIYSLDGITWSDKIHLSVPYIDDFILIDMCYYNGAYMLLSNIGMYYSRDKISFNNVYYFDNNNDSLGDISPYESFLVNTGNMLASTIGHKYLSLEYNDVFVAFISTVNYYNIKIFYSSCGLEWKAAPPNILEENSVFKLNDDKIIVFTVNDGKEKEEEKEDEKENMDTILNVKDTDLSNTNIVNTKVYSNIEKLNSSKMKYIINIETFDNIKINTIKNAIYDNIMDDTNGTIPIYSGIDDPNFYKIDEDYTDNGRSLDRNLLFSIKDRISKMEEFIYPYVNNSSTNIYIFSNSYIKDLIRYLNDIKKRPGYSEYNSYVNKIIDSASIVYNIELKNTMLYERGNIKILNLYLNLDIDSYNDGVMVFDHSNRINTSIINDISYTLVDNNNINYLSDYFYIDTINIKPSTNINEAIEMVREKVYEFLNIERTKTLSIS
jgi:hypothetical protein